MCAFIFTDQVDVKAVHRAELPPCIKSEDALLEALFVALRFPDYFGGNWNALDECITDLSWLPPGDVVLIHKDLPLADNHASLSVYLSVLRNAAKNWDTKGSNLIYASPEKWDATGEREFLVKRKFSVTFPRSAEGVVRSVLAKG
jgi:hypothetical protein